MRHTNVGKIGHVSFQLNTVTACVKRALYSQYKVATNG